MGSTQPAGSSGPSSNINSPIIAPGTAPFLNGVTADVRSSPAPPSNASVQADSTRSKRNKRDSRKKREAKGLDQETVQPKKKAALAQHTAVPSSEISILRPILLAEPRASDLLPPQPRQLNFVTRKTSDIIGQSWDFYEVVDKLTNKNGFRYSYAIADPSFSHIKYRQTDVPPYHARFSFEDSPAAIFFSEDARAVTTSNPWHTARANVCVREGTYYYEARVISGILNEQSIPTNGTSFSPSRGHVRLGFARREADLDANVGVDCYGYGIRDVNGEVVNRMRCEYFFPKGESIREGDVLGMLITLPPLSLHKKVVEGTYDPTIDGDGSTPAPKSHTTMNIIRDRIPFHYKSDFCWQQSNIFSTKHLRDYAFNLKETPTFGPPSPFNSEDPSLRTLPGSSITIFKNGVKMGAPFKQLYGFLPPASRLANGTNNLGIGERENADDGMLGYYPAVSCYGGGAVECRFEGPWWVGPPSQADNGGPVRGIGERFDEQIVEDVVADIVDEVEAMLIWGDVDGDVVGNAEVDSSSAGAVGGPEVLKGGVEAAYESSMISGSRTDSTAVDNISLGEGINGNNVGADHAMLEEAHEQGLGDPPNVEISSTNLPSTLEDVEMS
ncbi:SPRY domain-containing protein [Aspergillus clavatus NRRL 1]|uniref:Histone-lysine N-methyltransferase (Bre2), putative n=1 Tax=Aspergillus clavatus (strain ATCC 1007 / CBS 513.65 / DSM 816 / NCTC 3887 / NRRL 1 / QM 1276 / 107) TaxID=344612 RepID=A1CC54_ASPCL|nr:histone-lysine N-methyltransferase (Bre2), putative [Aspergillus clavatus NRRL 1]EAW12111.1 histone-lysine N-methyltransferase (Bre2), putative [Aspergillus clavatus NRRL 1]